MNHWWKCSLSCCWWKNPAPVDRWLIPLFTRFYTSQVVQDFFCQQCHPSQEKSIVEGERLSIPTQRRQCHHHSMTMAITNQMSHLPGHQKQLHERRDHPTLDTNWPLTEYQSMWFYNIFHISSVVLLGIWSYILSMIAGIPNTTFTSGGMTKGLRKVCVCVCVCVSLCVSLVLDLCVSLVLEGSNKIFT